MKIEIELFGASRDFSDQNTLKLEVNENSTIKDIKKKILDYLDKNFSGNENFKQFAAHILFSNLIPPRLKVFIICFNLPSANLLLHFIPVVINLAYVWPSVDALILLGRVFIIFEATYLKLFFNANRF